MSNYAITARYQPFSFQERIAPLLMLREEYDTVEQGLANMGEEANAWQQYIDPDSRSGQKLAAYNQALSETADNLSREGLKAVSRNTLFGLRRMYNQDISKINKAAQTLSGLYDQYRNMSAKDQTMMMGNMPTVDDLVDNPNAAPTFVSGTQLYAQGNAAAKAASARNIKHSAALDGVLRGYYHLVDTMGYDSDAVQTFLADNSTIPELQNAMAQIREVNGTANLNNPTLADTWILRGILDGMTYQNREDFKYDQYGAEQRALARAAAQAQAKFQAENPVRTRPIYTSRERSEDAKYFDELSKYFDLGRDGRYHLTDTGKTLFNKAEKSKEALGTPYFRDMRTLTPAQFLKKNELNGENSEEIERAFNTFAGQVSGDLPDATRTTEYYYNIAPKDSKLWLNKLIGTAKDGKVQTIQWDNKAKRFVPDEEVKVSNIEKGTVTSFNVSPYGNTVSVTIPGEGEETFLLSGREPKVDELISQELGNIQNQEYNIDKFIREQLGINPDDVGGATGLLAILQEEAAKGNTQAGYIGQILQNNLMRYRTAQHGLMAAMSQYGHANTMKETEYAGFDW